MLILSLTVVGVFSFRSLGVDLFPKIDLPTVLNEVRVGTGHLKGLNIAKTGQPGTSVTIALRFSQSYLGVAAEVSRVVRSLKASLGAVDARPAAGSFRLKLGGGASVAGRRTLDSVTTRSTGRSKAPAGRSPSDTWRSKAIAIRGADPAARRNRS